MVIIPIAPMERMELSKLTPTAVGGSPKTVLPFENILQSAVDELNQAKAVSDQNAYDLALGNVDNLHQIQIDSFKADSMLNTTVQLTTRLVNAYKEVMQMQV